MTEEKGIFNQVYDADEKDVKQQKKPQIKRALERKLQSAFDDAKNQIIDAENEINELRRNIENYDINDIIENYYNIKCLKEEQDYIRKEFKLLFNIEMK